MGTIEIKPSSRSDLWSIRAGDLSFSAMAAPHLEDLENNAVYRHLIHSHRRNRRQRIALIAAYLGAWLVLGPFYSYRFLAVPFSVSIVRICALVLVLSIGIANLYVFAGIEGYETNGWLKPRFFDVITSGISARDIVRGILGKTVSHYPPKLIQGGLLLGGSALLMFIFMIPLSISNFLFVWLLYLGVFGAFQLLGAFPSLPFITIPGTWLWYRGVRRSYEERLAQSQGKQPSIVASFGRLIVFLTISVSIVIVPILAYLAAGMALTQTLIRWDQAHRPALLVVMFLGFSVFGFLSGKAWGRIARKAAPGRITRLEEEIDRLFRIRGDVLFGG